MFLVHLNDFWSVWRRRQIFWVNLINFESNSIDKGITKHQEYPKKNQKLKLHGDEIWKKSTKSPANGHLFFRPRLRRARKITSRLIYPILSHFTPLRCADPGLITAGFQLKLSRLSNSRLLAETQLDYSWISAETQLDYSWISAETQPTSEQPAAGWNSAWFQLKLSRLSSSQLLAETQLDYSWISA